MSPAFILALTVSLMLQGAKVGIAPETKSDVATIDAILRLEREWTLAIKDGDQVVIDRIVAEDCVFVSSEGRLMNRMQAHMETRNRLNTLEASAVKEISVRVFGETAIVVRLTREVSKNRGHAVTQYRWIDVFGRRDNRWQVISSQSTRLD